MPGNSVNPFKVLEKLADALEWLADDPKLLSLVIIVLAVVLVVLGVVVQGVLDPRAFAVVIFALVIILMIGAVLAITYLIQGLRGHKKTTDRRIQAKERAYGGYRNPR